MWKVLIIPVLFFVSCVATRVPVPPGGVGILVFDGVLTSDVTAPAEVFGVAHKRGWTPPVYLISTTADRDIVTEEGLRLTADYSIDNAPQLDVVIATSAYDMAPQLNNAALVRWLKEQRVQADWLASNCSGAFLLAEAGALDGRRATTWSGGEPELQAAYPAVKVQTDARIVIDGQVLTSNGGVVSYLAAIELLGQMVGQDKAKDVAQTLQLHRL